MSTIIITGASTGIGKAAALLFHERGWKVAATMRNPDVAADWAPNSETFALVPLDVTSLESIRSGLSAAREKLGPPDVLVNNAGYGLVGPFEATTSEQVERQFRTNVLGLMDVTREILPMFRELGKGTLINISSVGGRLTFPLYSCYHSTKWAVEGFSESLQFELRTQNIKVKLVEPGPIKTDFYDRSADVVKKDGLTAYDELVQKTMPRMQGAGANAPGPERVAETIWQAATDGTWKLRYPINAAPLLWVRKLLPEGAFRSIIAAYLMR